jgi:hypothetical protein
LGREGAGPVQRIGRGGSFSPGRTGREERRIEIIGEREERRRGFPRPLPYI